MDKHFKLWFLCFCFPLMLFSQERNIAITPLLPAEVDIPESLRPMLQQKLLQIATTNGYGSESDDFILTANVMVLEKTAVPTVPPQINLTLEVSLYVINRLEKVIVAEKSVQIGGIDKTENSAYTQALKQLNPRKSEIRSFMTSAREKIVEYYTEKLPALLAKAQSLADMGNTDEALAVLSTIPEVVHAYADPLRSIGVAAPEPRVGTELKGIFQMQGKRRSELLLCGIRSLEEVVRRENMAGSDIEPDLVNHLPVVGDAVGRRERAFPCGTPHLRRCTMTDKKQYAPQNRYRPAGNFHDHLLLFKIFAEDVIIARFFPLKHSGKDPFLPRFGIGGIERIGE